LIIIGNPKSYLQAYNVVNPEVIRADNYYKLIGQKLNKEVKIDNLSVDDIWGKEYGWEMGGPIVVQSSVKADHLQEILESGIEPKHTIKQLQEASIIPLQSFENERLAALIELKDNENFQYWLGFKNFYVITRYNRSSFYAMSVHQLAEAIRNTRNPSR
jgi:hypothetical protein